MPKIYSYIIADKTKFYEIKQITNHFWEESCPVTKFYQIKQKSGTRVCRNNVFNLPVTFERAGVYF